MYPEGRIMWLRLICVSVLIFEDHKKKKILQCVKILILKQNPSGNENSFVMTETHKMLKE